MSQIAEEGLYVFEGEHASRCFLQGKVIDGSFRMRFFDKRRGNWDWGPWWNKQELVISDRFVKIPEDQMQIYLAKWRLLG